MKCSIIGINGYIGKHLYQYLSNKGWDIFGYGHSNECFDQNINYVQIDISNKDDLNKINVNVNYVFLLSGITGTKDAFKDYSEYIKVNEIGLLNILNKISNTKNKAHLIYPSTRLVYKGSEELLEENAPKECKTIYAANKLNAENLINAYSNYFNISFTIFRIGVPFGNLFDNEYSYGTTNYFIQSAINNNCINIYGDGSLRRTFTHIQYLCEQMYSILDTKAGMNEIYNIDGENLSLKEIALSIAKVYNAKINYVEWPKDDFLIESGSTIFNSAKIKQHNSALENISFNSWVASLKI